MVQGKLSDTSKDGHGAFASIQFTDAATTVGRQELVTTTDGGASTFRFNSGLMGVGILLGKDGVGEGVWVLSVYNAC